MAMSGGENRRVGSTGEIRVHAQVIDQIASRNESIVRVRGFMRAVEGSSTSHGTADMSTSATSGGTRNWPGRSFSVQGQSWTEVVSNDHTVPHRADGTRPLTATFTLGPTGTSRFGSGGTVSVSFNIDRIAQPPSKPSRPSLSNITDSGVRASWSAPASNGAPIDDYQVRVERGGSTVDSANTGTVRNHTFGGLDANTQYGVRVRARNSVGWGPYSDFQYFDTKVGHPAAPTNIVASRINDGRADISWVVNSSPDAPYGSQRVLRSHYTGTQWSTFTNVSGALSGSASSFVDTSITANGQYRYQVQAINDSGSATSSMSSTMRTTPGAPIIGTARKLSNGDIEVTYTPTVPYGDHIKHELQDNPGGTGWVTVATVVGAGALKHENPDPTKTHQYRVRTVDTYSSPNLAGAWSGVSNIVQLLAPPLAPSLVGPQGVADRGQPVRLEFQHNPVDTTDQTAGEVRWRPAGGSWTTVSTGTDPFYDLPAPGTSGTFEWQARTRGEHATFGPWSPTWSFDAVSRPEVVIQSPQGTSDQSQAEVVWAYQNADGSGQSRWEAQLLDAEDNVLATGSGSNTATSHLFPTVLDDATTYTVRVRARAGSGLWSEWDTVTFTTDFPLPAEVGVLAEWDRETGSVAVSFGPNEWATYGWDGTPNDSPSTRTDEDGTVTNVFENPDMVATDGDVVVFENLATPDWRGDPDLTEVENPDGTFTYTGKAVAGPYALNSVAIQSTQWSKSGGVSVRIITTVFSEDSTAGALVGGVEGVGGVTVWRYQNSPIGEVVLPEPFEALTNLMIRDFSGSHVSAPADNVPGETLMRIPFDEINPNPFILLLPGGRDVGDSVWYDLVTITDDLYNGEPFSGSTQFTIEAETLDVQRDDGDGWITIATDLDPETSIVDHTPRLGEVRYRTISRTTLPTARTGPETVTEPPRGLWPVFLNGGPDLGDVVAIYDNTQLAFDRERAKTRRVWAGRDWPTTKWGQARSKTAALTATISPESPGATMPEIEALEDTPSVVCVRDILGHKIFVTIDSVSADVERDGRWNVSIPMTREHYIEGVR